MFKLFENLFGNKKDVIKSNPVSDKYSSNILATSEYTIWKLISKIRDVSQTREYKYAEYDIMSSEVIISSALNMYADDSTQVDINSGKVLSIISNDDILVKDLYSFLERINFDNFVWDIAYNLSKYGNKYLKVYITEDKKDISHLESIDDPSCVLDLYSDGKPAYFAESTSDKTLYKESNSFNLYNHDSFIHYFIRSTSQSDIIELTDESKVDESNTPIKYKFKVIEGESLLEGVRVIYRILQSLEDSLLAARLAKSDYIRIFNVEIGNSTNTDARLIINKVKKLFDSTVSMDLRNGKYNAVKQPRAWADPIFNSISNGKGAITTEVVGGDFEVKSIVDIDYFTNKLFAGLRIPKPFLGFEESLGGSLDQSGTLSQLDIRYSRFIRKIMDSIVKGTTELCKLWLKLKGRSSSIDNFKVVYTSPSSLEDYSNLKEIKERASIVSELTDTIVNHAPGVDSSKILQELLSQFVPYQNFLDRVKPIIERSDEDTDSDSIDSYEEDSDSFMSKYGKGSSSKDTESDEDNTAPEDNKEGNSPSEE